jgi:Zn finger protein HypA/HybF involved in hydrogenase expression
MATNTRLDCLGDLARHQANLKVECRTCRKVTVIDAARFNRYCLLKRWNTQVQQLGHRLVCSRCGSRDSHLRATPEQAGPDPFPRNEQGWKALYKRLRD